MDLFGNGNYLGCMKLICHFDPCLKGRNEKKKPCQWNSILPFTVCLQIFHLADGTDMQFCIKQISSLTEGVPCAAWLVGGN